MLYGCHDKELTLINLAALHTVFINVRPQKDQVVGKQTSDMNTMH